MTRAFAVLLVLAVGLAVPACSPGGDAPESAEARGRRVYRNLCTACHNADPTRDGSVGPAVAGAGHELLEAKVLHGSYPPGYRPKRSTAAMPRYPQVADFIEDLAAFLAAPGTGGEAAASAEAGGAASR